MGERVQIAHPRAVTTAADDFVQRPRAAGSAEPMKRLTIDVPESLHTRIKLSCVQNRQNMADAVRQLLEERWPADEGRTAA
jgi:hypothetical protein